MVWARMLAYITGTVDQELLLRNEYLEKSSGTSVVYLAGAAFLCLVATAASYLPAYRAASIDPMKALRMD